MELLIIIVLCIAVFLIVKPYFIKYDNLVSFTGGLGAGKSFMSTQTAIVLYRKQKLWVMIYNIFHPKDKLPMPELYSNIPLRKGLFSYAIKLEKEHLLLQRRIVPRSVVFLDEVDSFANQFQHDNPCIVNKKGGDRDGNFDEFCRFFRHYTKGGYLIFNTQATANENLTIRRRQNTVIQLFHFRKWGIPLIWPNILYTVYARNVTLSDDVKTVEENNAEDNMRLIMGFIPLIKKYDTYCYSGRYETVPYEQEYVFKRLKTNKPLIAPLGHQEKLTTSLEPEEQEAIKWQEYQKALEEQALLKSPESEEETEALSPPESSPVGQ